VSDIEKDAIHSVTGKEAYLVPNGVDVKHFSVGKKKEDVPTLLYIGNSKYFQNREAIKKIITEIFPRINRKVRLIIVSDNITEEMQEAASINPYITIESNLRDVREAFRRSDIILVPVYIAGGTRIKILEAFASNVAVISTAIGVEGLEVTKNTHYLEANTNQDFVQKVNYLLDHPEEIDIISKAAYQRVSERYDWHQIALKLVSLYQDVFLK
jgi:polysaccharide biosynthesis protein PslH